MNTGSHFEVKQTVSSGKSELPAPMQERSKATARRFADAAMRLLKTKTFKELSVAELAAEAGRSVGVFYQRFGSKDDFLSVLLTAFFQDSIAWRSAMETDGNVRDIYLKYLAGGLQDIVQNKNLWHAALERSAADPEFWKTFGSIRTEMNGITRSTLETALGRSFTDEESRKLAVAGQVYNSVINNQIINGPGPLILEEPEFFDEMSRIVLRIAPFEGK